LEQAMSASRQPATATGSRLDQAGDSRSDRTDKSERSDQSTERFLQDLLVALHAAKAGEATRLDTRKPGLAGEVARAYNDLVDQNTRFSRELARVAKVVGQEGRMTVRVQLGNPTGTWATAVDAVNSLIDDLARPTGEVARVISAAAQGDLTQKMALAIEGRPMKGEFLRIGEVVNSMVDQLRAFADEVTRVAREVGTEGKLGGQATVPGVAGTWKDLTENVNQLASNLTTQVRNIAQVTTAVAGGDLSQKITVEARGEVAELKDTINTMVDQLSSFADEVTRVAREVGTEGKLGGQAYVKGVSGTWKDLTDNVNQLAGNLTTQVRNIAQVTTAVAKGDLSRKITVEVRGELLELKNTINTMVDQLSSFADEVTRVAREVGTEGKLGGQAEVKGVSGTWRDLTDSVNSMADNLTDQVRNIAQVTTAVARGDLSQRITVDARGEILELKNTSNRMVDQLSAFAAEVTRVAREVGTEGKLGGQAEVEGVSGTWKRLTENVNQLAGNLTTQVRAIAEVATAVTKGDLSSTITVDAPGEVGRLKDNINQMIANLRETTRQNQEQDRLKSNLARIGAMLQGHRDLETVSRLLMSELPPLVEAQYGAFYMAETSPVGEIEYKLLAGYGLPPRRNRPISFGIGEGLIGQAALEGRTILVTDLPDGYISIGSGLGEASPRGIMALPVLFEEQVLAVIELASFRPFTPVNQAFLEQIVETVGVVLNTIIATMRTEELLEQSQSLAEELQSQSRELQSQQEELQRTNEELQEKARQLARQNQAIEVKNAEIELARREVEERAEQLALSSRYKSEFLANMSHELRTPLNSLLILARLLGENADGNLTEREVDFARSIHAAGNDLLNLINDILDLTKVEAGKMDISPSPVELRSLCADLEQTFRPIADQQSLTFTVEIPEGTPPVIVTDEHRVEQVLKNLLSNAFKFTDHGSVALRAALAPAGTRFANPRLREAAEVIGLSVADTGIGISSDKVLEIFEAFQQGDGTTSRKYGGTGLGLSISREIAGLLGGEIQVESEPGQGSVFILFIPAVIEAPPSQRAAQAQAVPAGAAGNGDGSWFTTHTVAPGTGGLATDGSGRTAAQPTRGGGGLVGKRVLIIDDDVRNVYAITSALEDRGMEALYAPDGRAGIDLLEREPGIDLVLMDVMMPGMDGHQTTRAIRELRGFRSLPIIALTAKAMRGDREKSLAAGASDYITKPVDIDRLLEMMRVWLYR
jgi:signal transduction histidine kinase/HAMP domain-containing protein